jgi:hypothetical protein
MEAHEVGVKEKVEGIIKKYQKNFKHIGYSLHKLAAGEAKGKASNVSYCVEHFEDLMPK